MKLNILIAGVGGQGTLLASKILGYYASLMNYDCKVSEVHGMAQRGGSVVTYVKFGEKVYSPVIAEGDADVLLAFEELEAQRYAHNVKKGGKLIVNTQRILPLPVITGAVEYPNDILKNLDNNNYELFILDALKLAQQSGNAKAVNTVMIGKLAAALNFDLEKLKCALTMSVPQKYLEANLSALQSGCEN